MYINFQQKWVSSCQSNPCTQMANVYSPKNCKLQLEFRKITPFGHALATPLPIYRLILGSIGSLDIKLPRKDIDTDERTDGRTDIQTSRTTFFFATQECNLEIVFV